jgi:hypothetical protein
VRTSQKGVIAQSDDGKAPIMGELEVQVGVLWQSALPVKQALARRQFGPEAATAPNAKAMLERQEQFYVLRVANLPGSARTALQDREKVNAETALKVKGKPDLKAADIQAPAAAAPAGKGGAPGGPPSGKGGFGGGFGNVDLYYLFPRDAALSAADKEAEFVTKLGNITIRKKFKLSDMVFNGKFEM